MAIKFKYITIFLKKITARLSTILLVLRGQRSIETELNL